MRCSNLLFTVTFLCLWIGSICVSTASKPNPLNVLHENKCSRDNDCSRRMKCYDTGHGRRCAYSARLGVCPKPAISKEPEAFCKNYCSNDSDCSALMKCCDTGCGLNCVFSERKGFCPYNDIPATVNGKQGQAKCFSDFECRATTKCCARESSHDCLPILRERPGKCPVVCKLEFVIPCSSDHDCPENFKCCSNCDHKCARSEKVKVSDL